MRKTCFTLALLYNNPLLLATHFRLREEECSDWPDRYMSIWRRSGSGRSGYFGPIWESPLPHPHGGWGCIRSVSVRMRRPWVRSGRFGPVVSFGSGHLRSSAGERSDHCVLSVWFRGWPFCFAFWPRNEIQHHEFQNRQHLKIKIARSSQILNQNFPTHEKRNRSLEAIQIRDPLFVAEKPKSKFSEPINVRNNFP